MSKYNRTVVTMMIILFILVQLCVVRRGVARIFQRGGHTVSNIIVMAFSPRNFVGCLLKKRLTKGGHGHHRTPPRYALDSFALRTQLRLFVFFGENTRELVKAYIITSSFNPVLYCWRLKEIRQAVTKVVFKERQ